MSSISLPHRQHFLTSLHIEGGSRASQPCAGTQHGDLCPLIPVPFPVPPAWPLLYHSPASGHTCWIRPWPHTRWETNVSLFFFQRFVSPLKALSPTVSSTIGLSSDVTNKRSDVTTFRGAFESVMRQHYPHMVGHVAIRLVSAPPVCSDSLNILSRQVHYLPIENNSVIHRKDYSLCHVLL